MTVAAADATTGAGATVAGVTAAEAAIAADGTVADAMVDGVTAVDAGMAAVAAATTAPAGANRARAVCHGWR